MSLVLTEKFGAVTKITLNDPERLNAMSVAVREDFVKAVESIQADADCRCVIITGAGRAFSAGGHVDMLKEIGTMSEADAKASLKNFYSGFLKIRDLKQPVIAAINGPAVGAAFCLALACDLRVAVPEAKVALNFAKIGLSPGMAATFLLPRLVGLSVSSEMLLTGKTYLAKDLASTNLFNAIVEPEKLMPHVMHLAETIAENAPLAVERIKRELQRSLSQTIDQVFDQDSGDQAFTLSTQDFNNGIDAVLAKKKPVFVGK